MHSEGHERLHRVSRARTFAIWPLIGMGALMVWTVFAWSFLEPAAAVCLCLPPAALMLAHKWPTLLTLWGRSDTDVRLSMSVALIAGVVVPIGVPAKILNVANLPVLILPALVIGSLATAWALKTDPALRKRTWDAWKIAVCLVLYGGALVFWLNHVLPPFEEHRAVVRVTGLRMNQEIRGSFTTFHARTTAAPTGVDWDEYRVPRDVWKRLQVGAPACIDERRGLFGVIEAAITPCAAVASASSNDEGGH